MFTIGRNKHLIDIHKKLGWAVDETPSHEITKKIQNNMGGITAAIVGGVSSLVGTGVGMYSANKDRKNAVQSS